MAAMIRASPAVSLTSVARAGAARQARTATTVRAFPGQARSARADRMSCRASAEEGTAVVAGTVFEPFNEVQGELAAVSKTGTDKSMARMMYTDSCEAAVNEQINIEYNVSYIYHALYAYFDRDNVGLGGLAKFFKAGSEEERGHAEELMVYQNKRGGRVKLQSIMMPEMEFDHPEKGDALYAMELALSLEKLNFEKLTALHRVAEAAEDAQMCDFVEGFLGEQVDAIKETSEMVSQLRRVGKGHGVWDWDKELEESLEA